MCNALRLVFYFFTLAKDSDVSVESNETKKKTKNEINKKNTKYLNWRKDLGVSNESHETSKKTKKEINKRKYKIPN